MSFEDPFITKARFMWKGHTLKILSYLLKMVKQVTKALAHVNFFYQTLTYLNKSDKSHSKMYSKRKFIGLCKSFISKCNPFYLILQGCSIIN